MLSPRQRKMIAYMLQEKKFITIENLANYFHVSQRSIQYDLKNIEYYAENHGARILRNKRYGVQLVATQEIIQEYSVSPHEKEVYFSPEERKEKILILLFESLEPISSSQFADWIFVSRRTIVDDLKEVQSWLVNRQLKLNYVSNKGFKINGPEQKFRESYVEILIEHYEQGVISPELRFLSNQEIVLINRAVDKVLDRMNYKIVQRSRDGLALHLAITIHRNRNNYKIKMPTEELKKLLNEPEFTIAEAIKEDVEDMFLLKLPEAETGYITLHLLGAKQADLDIFGELREDHLLEDDLKAYIQRVSIYLGVDLTSDSILMKGLTVHLRPAVYRLRFNMRNDNPLKEEIQKRYPNVISAAKFNLQILEEAFEVEFNEDEIAYIAMHIGSAIERKLEHKRYKFNVLLLCASGVGTSQLLKSRIENYYPEFNIHDVLSVYDIENVYFTENNIDWVISTVQTRDFPVPVINVSPFLTKTDREKMNVILNNEREKTIEKNFTNGPVLSELLRADYIDLDIKAADYKEAIAASVDILIKNNVVTPQYLNAIMDQFWSNGPYMVIKEEIAMPHAKPSEGVRFPGLSFVRLKNPVVFGHENYDPVRYVICLATIDAHIHLNALRQLTMLIQDPVLLNQFKLGDQDTLIALINQVSQL